MIEPAEHVGAPALIWPWLLTLISLSMVSISAAYLLGELQTPKGWLSFWSFRPVDIIAALADLQARSSLMTLGGLFSALMLHADWVHLFGNLAYFWAFGVSVEKAVGHWRFALLFFLLGGLANLYAAWQLYEIQNLPVIGASGGVSAIIGVYLGLFPRRRMGLWLPLGLYLQFARLPAVLVIGSWFTLQLLYSVFGPTSHGVAWSAHLAGFALGVAAALLLRMMPGTLNLAYRDE
ncbi:MAG: rhomboid family intramembrane serine protease [Wenzhouxiangella sp.]|jgi:membrane associated rhomboid family serine protease|nr:rhomboid family intramembrane serine protease [Wenzhouxiangella sp.]